ncbi:MAG TPA: LuxR C-terminal-related transcriptional regulator, partial [Chroococcales cyanobacterium]
ANQTALQLFGRSQTELIGQTLSKISADGQKLTLALRELDDKTPTTMLSGILVPSAPGHAHHLDAFLSLLAKNARDEVSVILYPTPSERQQERKTKATSTATSASHDKSSPAGDPGSQSSDELAAELANISRELTWERWVRQIICKLHASLDRDTLLQTVVDGFGRALGASRCLIVRTDGPASPMVTHEYAEPDTSPLGLGRTGQFPSVIVSYFRHRVAAIPDLASLERSGELSGQEYEYFLDNGIRGITGAPIASHGFHYGVIIILESGATRKWSAHELDMLEIAATQTAVALGHCQAYLQLKDQLFNMNLLGNPTQQLTNTLEMVSRSGKTEAQDERSHTGGSAATGQAPPLSLRELEVLKLIASGLANREIAQRLFLTESTVELHASRIRKKLKLKSRTALVKYACDNGLA